VIGAIFCSIRVVPGDVRAACRPRAHDGCCAGVLRDHGAAHPRGLPDPPERGAQLPGQGIALLGARCVERSVGRKLEVADHELARGPTRERRRIPALGARLVVIRGSLLLLAQELAERALGLVEDAQRDQLVAILALALHAAERAQQQQRKGREQEHREAEEDQPQSPHAQPVYR
jgi:hypothetical protein